jgi:hypothetical protein
LRCARDLIDRDASHTGFEIILGLCAPRLIALALQLFHAGSDDAEVVGNTWTRHRRFLLLRVEPDQHRMLLDLP